MSGLVYRLSDGTCVQGHSEAVARILAEPSLTAQEHGRAPLTFDRIVASMGYDRAHARGHGELYDRLIGIA